MLGLGGRGVLDLLDEPSQDYRPRLELNIHI